MKLELIYQKNNLTGEEIYWTKRDGNTIESSISRNYDEAMKFFNLIKKGETTTIKILEVYEVPGDLNEDIHF
jgi:hypothetical protein